MNNHSTESHFAICHSASFSSQLSITMNKNKLFKEKNFKVQICINCNEENKFCKLQNRYQLHRRKYAIQSTKLVSVTMKKISYSK